MRRARELFSDFGVRVVTGSHFLGGFVGDHCLTGEFVSTKVQLWSDCIKKLADIVVSQLQAAHAALAR